MVPLGISSSPRKSSPPPPPICSSPNLLKPQDPPPHSPSFHLSHKIMEGGRNYTEIPSSSGEEKHVDTYMLMKTTRNRTRTKYSKEVS